jgi:hypothetical protein
MGLLGIYPVWLHLENSQPAANDTSSTNTRAVIAVSARTSFPKELTLP